MQYKKKCGEVEQQLLEKATELEQERLTVRDALGAPCPKSPNQGDGQGGIFPQIQLDASGSQPEEESSNELENALIRLEEEQQRWAESQGDVRIL